IRNSKRYRILFKRQIKELIIRLKNYFNRINKNIDSNDNSKIKTVKNIFIELKNNLIFSNMMLVFGLVTVSFIAIFVFMKQTLYSNCLINMKSIIYKNAIISYQDNNDSDEDKNDSSDEVIIEGYNQNYDQVNIGNDNNTSDEENGYIFITYSELGNVIVYNDTRYVIKSEELINDFNKLVSSNEVGTAIRDGISYRYLVNKNAFPANTYKIVFYNLSSEHKFLKLLGFALVVIDLILSVISYYISLYITNKCISPIREAMDRQKQFTEDASHELRTPLTVMQTNLEVLKSEKDSTIKEQYKWIEYIDDEVVRMTNLVSDLLTLSRMDNNKHNEEMQEVNLTEELFKIIEAYQKYVKNKNLELRSNIDKNIYFTCQKEKIIQLINIFLDNAIKYNKPNGYIELSLKKYNKNNKTFDIIIEDSGIGIAKEDQKKIFNRFFRSDSSRSTEGTGLGLSIAQSIIDKHNGTIKIESEKDKGTKFIISFPYYDENLIEL
ncbi:MAG: HAMP domain-containing histidine kinase, partial [archaeon]|nr:HAMP domain-containing histidine kinase [archaeon]